MSVTHLAGPLVGFRKLDRVIQRCCWCGDKLMDYKPSETPVADNGDPPAFTCGHLIQVRGKNPEHFRDIGPFVSTEVPDDFCYQLVE